MTTPEPSAAPVAPPARCYHDAGHRVIHGVRVGFYEGGDVAPLYGGPCDLIAAPHHVALTVAEHEALLADLAAVRAELADLRADLIIICETATGWADLVQQIRRRLR